MNSTILLVSCSGWLVSEPPVIRPNPFPTLPFIDRGAMDRDLLQTLRSSVELLEGTIEMYEGLLNNPRKSAPQYTPEGASRVRQQIEEWRAKVDVKKKTIRELERGAEERTRNPDPRTARATHKKFTTLYRELTHPEPALAPMPREVRR